MSLFDHDSNSVLVDCCGPETSWDRFETEEVVVQGLDISTL